PNPVNRGNTAQKIHLITDRNGLAPVRRNLGRQRSRQPDTDPVVKGGIPPVRSRRGPRRRRPAKLMVTRATTTATCADGYPHAASGPASPAGRGQPPAAGPPPLDHRPHHGLAGRLPAPPPPLRTRAEHFLAFTSVGCTLICYRTLAR